MELGKILFIVIGVYHFAGYADAVITGWTKPTITSAANGDGDVGDIAEDLVVGSTTGITLIAVSDGTLGSYTLSTATSNGATFKLTGAEIFFESGTLDHETAPKLVLVVKVTDDDPSEGTATVTITVTDVNEPPAFMPSRILQDVCDGAAAATSIVALNGTDQDGDTLTGLTIAAGNTNTDFSLSGTNIVVATGKTLSRATTASYILQVEVNDGQSTALTGTATVAISVSACSGVAGLAVSMVTVIMAVLLAYMN